ncbi:MAG: class I SAM-dependent methyltransferase [Deltaproteobacteria bacterium]|nr:class I SAM-dependent methyltransferase [Deltaproteobacteria bacterium]
MRLSEREFRAMNSVFRRLVQRTVEFPIFRHFDVPVRGMDVLEIGCGTGYGAQFLLGMAPKSYVGIDLMPEQIALARQRRLEAAEFHVQDAADLGRFASAGIDTVVIFGALHHIRAWRQVVAECARVLKIGGWLYVEEPEGAILNFWELLFRWGHPDEPLTLRELRAELASKGFTIRRKRRSIAFGFYAAQKTG